MAHLPGPAGPRVVHGRPPAQAAEDKLASSWPVTASKSQTNPKPRLFTRSEQNESQVQLGKKEARRAKGTLTSVREAWLRSFRATSGWTKPGAEQGPSGGQAPSAPHLRSLPGAEAPASWGPTTGTGRGPVAPPTGRGAWGQARSLEMVLSSHPAYGGFLLLPLQVTTNSASSRAGSTEQGRRDQAGHAGAWRGPGQHRLRGDLSPGPEMRGSDTPALP